MPAMGMIRMTVTLKSGTWKSGIWKIAFCLGLLAAALAPAQAKADEFKLSNNQRISCGRGLAS
jgi:hypothetical protein